MGKVLVALVGLFAGSGARSTSLSRTPAGAPRARRRERRRPDEFAAAVVRLATARA